MNDKRILIVEDEKLIADLERDYLQAAGFAADIAYDGKTGLDMALKGGYAFILLDVMLPGIDGFEICRRVRERMDVPVMMVTARRDDIDKIKGLGLGADDYMVKPFSPSEMVARVRAHIAMHERLAGEAGDGAAGAGKPGAITLGDLRIEPATHRVFIGDREIQLVNREFELLLFLSSNPGIVFSKDTLFDRVWGLDASGDTATVTVHINRLREKMGDNTSSPHYIETVWGAGYRMKAGPQAEY